ncbi:copper homeostasis protein CutC [Listeria cossartiae subsp. cayugensis]|uniref:PF03932 family protein CutC n=1 Tax=Listeria cossartiae subsp. cayugensis TaxID=2713505 RepID=A0ABU2IKP2_9LIST|nr:copper homeostasis protein CutC [Listeria cossartiae]MDS9999445.1 copper homeostasis protein CutC [Listeria cossartiae subsp. cayugensis]MDT0002646.1 copper homeostasis protein CutC [Listeria cossartiae subsp. cayugensis]MDT0008108.1 copper homeostasis protein CutC [Listeria cossartiae subsp. cayugensis]MDT0018986.1 copper homeostasis protein CutC [Listeria cossartiae subsp. cayugensis]MDT0029477.1 copper homeostasis protein CutC [Listeria cossartiae subsp. cayugensis]
MLEVIVQNPRDAYLAEKYGADRMEVVSAISEGGLTPSYGAIKEIVRASKLPAMMMIRPHSFSFVYDEAARIVMERDIELAKEVGVKGIVYGGITADGDIDQSLLEKVIEWKGDLDLTFHRALEATKDIEASYQVLRTYGKDINQLLTSGGTDSALDSLPRLKRWIQDSQENPDSFQILVGSGVKPENIATFQATLNHTDYHVGSAAREASDFSKDILKEKIATLQQQINNH